MEQTAELRDAIEKLYATFATYPLRENTDACPCCHSEHDERRLHAKPLRMLDANDLREFVQGALHVWGGVEDFKHFLPRIFELAVEDSAEFADAQIAVGKLKYCEWWNWPQAERKAIRQFLDAVWSGALDMEPNFSSARELDDWMCGIALAENGVGRCLATWEAATSENAALNLASLIVNTGLGEPNSTPSGYWNDCPESYAEVSGWLRSLSVKARIKAIADQHPEFEFAERAYISLP